MSVDSDILAATPITATGQVLDNSSGTIGRARVVGIYYVASVAGSVTLSDGVGGAGSTRITIPVAASASGMVNIPQSGILFTKGIWATVTGATLSGMTVMYTG